MFLLPSNRPLALINGSKILLTGGAYPISDSVSLLVLLSRGVGGILFEKLLNLIKTYIMHSRAYFALIRHFCYIGDIEQRAWVTDSANRRR